MILHRLSSSCFNPPKKSQNDDSGSMSNFRRTQSKVFYASEVWDPGVSEAEEEVTAEYTRYRQQQQHLNDILEEDEEDLASSPSPPASEEGSFRRRLPRGSNHRRSQESSSSSSNDSNSVRRRSYVNGNHKSQDSGFSDSAESDNNPRARFAPPSQTEVDGGKTRHISKVYFYSRDDSDSNSGSGSPMLSPPLSPPPFGNEAHIRGGHHVEEEEQQQQLYDCDILDSFLEHKPILPTVSTQTHRASPRLPTATPVLYIGTSSLGRRGGREEALRRTSGRPASPRDSPCKPQPALFPKTNGSLYDHRRGTGGSLYHPHGIITVPETHEDTLPKANESRADPVDHWLKELASVQEAECTIMLQSKPLLPPPTPQGISGSSKQFRSIEDLEQGHSPPLSSSFWAGSSKDTIRAIQARAHSISALFAKLCRQLEQKGIWKLSPLVQGLAHQIDLFLAEYNKYNHVQLHLPGYKSSYRKAASEHDKHSISEGILHQQRILRQHCDRLKLAVSRSGASSSGGNSSSPSGVQTIVDVIKVLGPAFTKLIELMLSKEILVSERAH